MAMHFLRRTHIRESIAALAIAAYFLVALVPTGFMPSVDGIGWLKLCTAQGTLTVPGSGDTQSPSHDVDAACAFALATASAAPPPAPPHVVATLPFLVAASLPSSIRALASSGPPRSQSSRGPPGSLTT